MSRLERSSDVRATIERLAAQAFENFELTYDAESMSWSCRNPKHGHHAFRLYFQPGMIVMWGDIGEYVWRHSDSDSIGWYTSQGAKTGDYPDYFLGKLRACDGPIREFHVGDAYAYIDERIAEFRAEWDREVAGITHDDEDPDYANRQAADLAEHFSKQKKPWEDLRTAFNEKLAEQLNAEDTCWYLAWTEAGFDDPPAMTGWTGAALWAWHACRTFARLHAARAVPTPIATEVTTAEASS